MFCQACIFASLIGEKPYLSAVLFCFLSLWLKLSIIFLLFKNNFVIIAFSRCRAYYLCSRCGAASQISSSGFILQLLGLLADDMSQLSPVPRFVFFSKALPTVTYPLWWQPTSKDCLDLVYPGPGSPAEAPTQLQDFLKICWNPSSFTVPYFLLLLSNGLWLQRHF